MTATCQTCRWWNEGAPALAVALREVAPAPAVGSCERLPPVPVCRGYAVQSIFPTTHADRGCGEHQPVGGEDGDGEEADATGKVIPMRTAA